MASMQKYRPGYMACLELDARIFTWIAITAIIALSFAGAAEAESTASIRKIRNYSPAGMLRIRQESFRSISKITGAATTVPKAKSPPPAKKVTNPPPKKAAHPPPKKAAHPPPKKAAHPPPKRAPLPKKAPPPPPKKAITAGSTSLNPNRPPPPPTGPSPGPQCTGPCCSNKSPLLGSDVPTMPSKWWSNQMAHGAQIQIKTSTWSTWWYPKNKGTVWSGATTVYGDQTIAPPVTSFLRVIRISDSQVQFLTPSGTYLRAGPPAPAITASNLYGAIDMVADSTDPATVFRITFLANGISINIQGQDGLYISCKEGPLLRWSTTASDWETYDVREVQSLPSIRGVNIGSWLVYEAWMDPSFFPSIFKYTDAAQVTFQSAVTKKFISAAHGLQLTCSAVSVSSGLSNETFYVRRQNYDSGYWQFRLGTGKSVNYWSVANGQGIHIIADTLQPGAQGSENFNIVFSVSTPGLVLLQAPNGNYFQAKSSGDLEATISSMSVNPLKDSTWGNAAFKLDHVNQVQGEYQISSGMGTAVTQMLQNRATTMLTEEDWVYMKNQGINAVRIPVGYWLAQGLATGTPFPRSDAALLDWAFEMGNKHGIRIWISMHAAPGSQNGFDHSGTRDGLTLLFKEPGHNKTLIDSVAWMAQRYAANAAFLGIGLLNEPLFVSEDIVPLADLQNYYVQAYDAVRKYSKCAYLSIMNRIGSNPWAEVMWLMLDDSHTNTMLEEHAYHAYSGTTFQGMTAQQEIDTLLTDSVQSFLDLQSKTTSSGESRPLLIGEFSNAMYNVPSPTEQAEFGKKQLQLMAKAQGGWFFWSYKLNRQGYEHWNWKMSSANGWLPQKPGGGWW